MGNLLFCDKYCDIVSVIIKESNYDTETNIQF